MLAAVVEPDGAVRWLDHVGATTIAVGMNVGWIGDTVAAGGYFGGTATRIGSPSAGSGQNALVVRYDGDGHFAAEPNWGGSSNVQLRALETTADRLVIGGLYAGTMDLGAGGLPATGGADNGYLAAMAPDGSDVVARSFNGSSDVYVNDAALRPDGGACITGRFNATTDLGGGPVTASGSTVFVACYDAQLGYQWARTFGSGATGSIVEVLPDGDCVAAGTFIGTLSLDGTSRTSAGMDDVYVIRFDGATGATEWMATIGGAGDDGVIGAVAVGADQIAVAGRVVGAATIVDEPVQSEGGSDGFVVLLSAQGARLRTELLGGSGDVELALSGMAIDALATRLALALTYSGELRVRDLASTAVAADGALVILPMAAGSSCPTC